MTREERHKRWEDMRAFKSQGHTMQEVADKFAMSIGTVQQICKGVAPQKSNVKPANKGVLKSDIEVAQFISERMPEVEYAGNYTGADGRADIKCKTCGTVFNRSMISIRKRHCACPECAKRKADRINTERAEMKRLKTEQKREEREALKTARERKREHERQEKYKAKKHPCAVCGTITDRPKYCSDTCMKKACGKAKEQRRRVRIKAQMIDNDITVEGLFRRDAGKCWLCGERCNFEDYTVRDGNFIAGDWYPSIDHVLPISKGGEHSWNNVRLAHHRCNWKKRDKIM